MPRELLDELKELYEQLDNPEEKSTAGHMILALVKGYMIGIGEWDEEFSDDNN